MMNIILFDDPAIRSSLLPLTWTRPVAMIRTGIFRIHEKWGHVDKTSVSFLTEDYLQRKFQVQYRKDNIYINGALCPDEELIFALRHLLPGEALIQKGILLAVRTGERAVQQLYDELDAGSIKAVEYKNAVCLIDKPWKIFQQNAAQIRADIKKIRAERASQQITDPHTVIYGRENVFVEEGVSVKAAIIDAENGPVYLGKNSTVLPGAIIRGAFAMLDHAQISMGARIRGDSTFGPYTKIGGEVGNSVVFGYTNKAHDGYLGNSVIGEWCNLGADTNTSNMKNDYGPVRLWDYSTDRFADTGTIFCGLIMGDHSKSGINTMFNSGCSVGVSCNIYGPGYPRTFIPSFSKGGATGLKTLPLKSAVSVAETVLERRAMDFNRYDQEIFQKVFELTASYRR